MVTEKAEKIRPQFVDEGHDDVLKRV